MVLYDAGHLKYWVVDDAESELQEALSPAVYAEAMFALGLKPVIDIWEEP